MNIYEANRLKREAKAKEAQLLEQKIIEAVSVMNITNLLTLFRLCGYDPEKIGIELLKAQGYQVKEHYLGDVAVSDANGNLLFFKDNGVEV